MKMKKIFAIAAGAIAIVSALSSCNKILEQESPSSFDGSTVFANYDLAESTVFGITEAFCEVNSYRGRFLPWYGFNTDIEWYNTYKPGDGKSDIAGYDCAVNNAQLNTSNNPYVLMYTGIERANLIIEGLREYGKIDTDADMAYLLGEALTLRAMIYYALIKAWGDVPARFDSINSETIYLPKTDRDEIFIRLLSDLQEAIDYLPYPGKSTQTSRTDRINKMFAQGLYARIVLMASGYALRPDDGKVGTGDAGTIRLSSNSELSKEKLYPTALSYLKEAIESGSASLESDYEQMWYNLNNMNNLTAGPGYETLYVIPFGEGRGRWNFTFAVASEGASITNGVSRGGDAGPVPTMFFKYGNYDQRRDVTCVNYKWTKTGEIEPSGISKWYFGKYRFEWMDAQPYTGGNDDGIKPVVMRYSDILLMAAEMENELNGPSADAKKWLQAVRERAYKGHEDLAEAYVAGLTSKEDFFQAIIDERALEFCGEFLRKVDLIRWNLLKANMDKEIAAMKDLRDMAGDYAYLADSEGKIWYKYAEDEKSIEIWGLAKGQQVNPGADYEPWTNNAYVKYDDSKKSDLYTARIEGIYYVDPDTRQFWPIFQDTITNSQGVLVNDYGY